MTSVDAAAAGIACCGAIALAVGGFVWRRRQGAAGTALAALLAAIAVWNATYAVELLSADPGRRLLWGDLKYVGIGALTPCWLVFILAYTGRSRYVTRALVAALCVEPVAVLLLLAVPQTHDLIRSLPPGTHGVATPVSAGPLFWVHLGYTDTVNLAATALFVGALLRRSRVYWAQAAMLIGAALLPWAASLLFNLGGGALARVDGTPIAFTASGAVLAWGLFRQRLLNLAPIARSVLVEQMTDAVVVLDEFGHVVDSNPAAQRLLAADLPARGRDGAATAPLALRPYAVGAPAGTTETRLPVDGETRDLEVAVTALSDTRGRPAGRLLVLRDITERKHDERRLRDLLAERARVAETLAQSLRPLALPSVPGVGLAARYRPAGGSREVGGDFYDVHAVGDAWAFVLGDVSGKGATAAAATAFARYTLRAVARPGGRPSETLRTLNGLVAGQYGEETYLTVVFGLLRPTPDGVHVTLALGGHPQPLLVHGAGGVEAVGEPGSAVGLLPDPDFTDVEVCLRPGDNLFLSTDGVGEARNGRAFFGDGPLVETVAGLAGQDPETMAETVLRRVLAYRTTGAADDIAILVVHAEGVTPAAGSGPRRARP